MNTTLTGNYTVNALTGEKTIAMAAGNASGRGVAAAALPRDMTFTEENAMTVGVYSVLCGVGTIGNLTVFVTLYMNRDHLRSRINLFIVHLSIADLIVALIMMPLEIGWNSTVEWKAGDAACRILMFFRTFGFYLSSFILVAISIDRYCAIARPLSMKTAEARGRIMLIAAWILSAVASLPQGIIFHTERHPEHPWFVQCVTFNFFPNAAAELAYNMFNIITLYLFPLCVIVVLYSLIVCLMSRRARQQCEAPDMTAADVVKMKIYRGRWNTSRIDLTLRCTNADRIRQARLRTLKMTIVIVSVFIICWTPYFVISLWYWFDQTSAAKIHPKVQKCLFLFAVSNSCMDPIVYGMFSTAFQRSMRNRLVLCRQYCSVSRDSDKTTRRFVLR